MSGVLFGFHSSHEQHPPSHLLEMVQRAEQAGFTAAMCSDHFHPWSARQGESGFAWSWLGAALQATTLPFGVVNAPGQRYHPAIIAQAAATLAEMYPGRFWLSIGSGEASNENITGELWPVKSVRNARLAECANIIRALWEGQVVDHVGLVKVREAKLYTLPKNPPRLFAAALTPETARWAATWADGLITTGSGEGLKEIVEAFREGGGENKPMVLQSGISYAPTMEEAVCAAHDQWRHCVVGYKCLADYTSPQHFDDATQFVPAEEVTKRIRCSNSYQQHIEWIGEDMQWGFEQIHFNHVGSNLQRFIDAFGENVLPAVKKI